MSPTKADAPSTPTADQAAAAALSAAAALGQPGGLSPAVEPPKTPPVEPPAPETPHVAVDQKSAPRKAKETHTCKTRAQSPLPPGSTVVRWGISWTVGSDGRTLTGEVLNELVEGGVGAGRWLADGMPTARRNRLVLEAEYRAAFKGEADPAWSDAHIQLALDKRAAKRKGQAKSDFDD